MNQANQQTKAGKIQVDVNLDSTPILYTDRVLLHTNKFGVVLNIGQNFGESNRFRIVARLGMSREHAKKLTSELGKLLAITEGRINTADDIKKN